MADRENRLKAYKNRGKDVEVSFRNQFSDVEKVFLHGTCRDADLMFEQEDCRRFSLTLLFLQIKLDRGVLRFCCRK